MKLYLCDEGNAALLYVHHLLPLSASKTVGSIANLIQKFNLFNYLPLNHQIDLMVSSLKWCSLIHCNWCVSLNIGSIILLALK